MTIETLFVLCHPLIDVLGTLCLIVLMAAGVLYVTMLIVRKIWKFVLTAGALATFLVILALALGVL